MSEAEGLFSSLCGYYGCVLRPKGILYIKGDRLFLYTGSDQGIKCRWRGLHIANTDLSLTIEGSQLLGPHATKNIVEVDSESAKSYFRGEDITAEAEGHVILETRDRVIGCAHVADGVARNILHSSRKTRR